MSLFRFRNHQADADLEKALQGAMFSEGMLFNYNLPEPRQGREVRVPVYFLPIEGYDDFAEGSFIIDEKIAEVPIGFMQKRGILFTDYFHLDNSGRLKEVHEIENDTVYLPLRLTDLFTNIGTDKDGKFVPFDGSPFHVYGIHGSQGTHPLIIISENEQGLQCKGIYKNPDGQLETYTISLSEPLALDLEDHLRILKLSLGATSATPDGVTLSPPPQQQQKTTLPTKKARKTNRTTIDWNEPVAIVEYLDQYVIGQDEAKKVVAVAFSNYMTKVSSGDDEIKKSNLLLIGSSGVGKTYMISLLAKQAKLPLVQSKLTGKSTEGYKGENLSTALDQIRAITNGQAPYGIVFFDEIDKIAQDAWSSGSGFGPRIQDELIGWLEEAVVISDTNHGKNKPPSLNTKNILFVAAGAFQSTGNEQSLVSIVNKRLGIHQRQMGFSAVADISVSTEDEALQRVRPEDLITYGLKPELVGRLPYLAVLHSLTVQDRVAILKRAKNSPFDSFSRILEQKGYTLEFDPGIHEVIAHACPSETGARALGAICNNLFTQICYNPKVFADERKRIRIGPELATQLITLYK